MPSIIIKGHDHIHAACDILRMYYAKIDIVENTVIAGTPGILITNSAENGLVTTKWQDNYISMQIEVPASEISIKREVKRQLYQAMVSITGISFPWGSLTGIRPTIIASECINDPARLQDFYFVSKSKAALATETAFYENEIQKRLPPELIHCYINIPFCRSRCEYCSFVSEEYQKNEKWIPLYVDALIRELTECMPDIAADIQTVYIGGGTPTSLPDQLFENLLKTVHAIMNGKNIKEFTIEAGRADSITEEKLDIMKKYGVSRICINPQTFKDATLQKIGRSHTAGQVRNAYGTAVRKKFKTINMDLIAGLPGETFQDFKESLDELIRMNPENITIHSLSLKNSSDMTRNISENQKADVYLQCFHMPNIEISDMIEYSYSELKKHGYHPYYLYRQKNTAGGHENTGYTKAGHECLYNVAMMSDRNSVVAFGAGAISKRYIPSEPDLRKKMARQPNIKDIREYLERIDELINKKKMFFGGDQDVLS
ncbi:MAG: coproporphyrinogen dehydrogenase HemZ [Saccharofermentanales bacterium]